MKVVEQSAELLNITHHPLFLIERCGRVCYKSEDRLECESCGGSGEVVYGHDLECKAPCPDCLERAGRFVRMIIDRGHESVLEHANATFLFVTDRGISHEIVRHRLCAYSQESTRYCNYGNKDGEISVIRPVLEAKDESTDLWANNKDDQWRQDMYAAEKSYLDLIKRGESPQWARSVLPTCLKTEIVVTANFRQWRHMLKLRAINKKAHPQIRQLFRMALDKLHNHVPVVFDDVCAAFE